jgi:NADH-quinone oxidoreductase subunit B
MDMKKTQSATNLIFPGQIHETPDGGFLVTKLDEVVNWARSNSLWPLIFGTSCCAIEMMSAADAKYDWSRFGFEVARATPRQADLLIVSGTIVMKMAPVLKLLYDQMPEPKYVIAMGACTISGGPFFYNTYSVVKGVDHIIPVDVYIPGCPPRPEALLHAMITLQEKIKHEPCFRKAKVKIA